MGGFCAEALLSAVGTVSCLTSLINKAIRLQRTPALNQIADIERLSLTPLLIHPAPMRYRRPGADAEQNPIFNYPMIFACQVTLALSCDIISPCVACRCFCRAYLCNKVIRVQPCKWLRYPPRPWANSLLTKLCPQDFLVKQAFFSWLQRAQLTWGSCECARERLDFNPNATHHANPTYCGSSLHHHRHCPNLPYIISISHSTSIKEHKPFFITLCFNDHSCLWFIQEEETKSRDQV